MCVRILLVQGDSNKHLGLFRDLENVDNIDIITFPNHKSQARKILTRVSSDATFYIALKEQGVFGKKYDRVVIVDTAYGRMTRQSFEWLHNMAPEVKLLLLNSFGAASPSIIPVKRRMEWLEPQDVYTFDRTEASQLGYNSYGICYYSNHHVPVVDDPKYDCYFVGGIKGGRGRLIRELYASLRDAGIKALFECTFMKNDYEDTDDSGIRWMHKTWQPYEDVLSKVANSRCIVEILQEGQHAQSLRYFEAVCQNKKLLTNNPSAKDMPYFDERYMRVFRSIEDIDFEWLKQHDRPNYEYRDSFSPLGSPLFSVNL